MDAESAKYIGAGIAAAHDAIGGGIIGPIRNGSKDRLYQQHRNKYGQDNNQPAICSRGRFALIGTVLSLFVHHIIPYAATIEAMV